MEDSAALRRLQNQPMVPTIDFTTHTMDDGRVVHTQERVVKGKNPLKFIFDLSRHVMRTCDPSDFL
jgi:hypothetical protein